MQFDKTFLFIEKAKKVHGDKYDYSLVDYVNSNSKIPIICKEHGVFEQIVYSHLSGSGCPQCGKLKILKKKTKNKEYIEREGNLIHENRYDYSLVIYKNAKTAIDIICHLHGIFKQTPSNHLHKTKPQGCPKCGIMKRSKNRTYNTEKVIKKANIIHNNLYEYHDNIGYINSKSIINIFCKNHGYFSQKANNHLNGKGCPKCRNFKSKCELKLYDFINKNFHTLRHYKNKKILNRQHIDIFIPYYNIGVEYQGEQHFKSIKHFGGEKTFTEINERDKRKMKICLKNNIKLFYFTYKKSHIPKDYPYKVYNDEEELLKAINEYIEEKKLNKEKFAS